QQEGGDQGKWNLESRDASGGDVSLRLSLVGSHDEVVPVAFPYFGGARHDYFQGTDHDEVLVRNMAARRVATREGETLVVTVYD
ncbi:nitrate reductase subunit alpha, partial [Bacillus subtilis]